MEETADEVISQREMQEKTIRIHAIKWPRVISHSRVVFVLLVLCVLSANNHALAQHLYTLDECISAAKSNSPNLRIAEIQSHSSSLARDEARTTSLPIIRFDAAAIYAPHYGNFGYDPALSNGGQLNGRISLNQPLYDGGARRLRVDQLGVEIDRSAATQQAAAHDVRLAITQAFIEVLRTHAMIALRRESRDALEKYFNLVNTMRAAGTASQSDVLKTQVDLDAENIGLTRAIETDSLARIVLAQRMGIAGVVDVAGSLESLPVEPIAAGADSTPRNIDTKIAELDIAAGTAEAAVGATEKSPALFFGADAGLLTSLDNLSRAAADRQPALGASVGFAFGVPLSSWGAFDLRAQQRELGVDVRRERLRLLTQTISAARNSLLLQMRSTIERRESLKRTIATAQDNISLITTRFSAGAAGSLDVLTAHQTLFQLRSDAVDAEAEVHQIAAQMARVMAQE